MMRFGERSKGASALFFDAAIIPLPRAEEAAATA
jgi:hypothetical protein